MKRQFFLIVAIASLLTTQVSASENDSTVHKSVTVTREFQPVIHDAGKIITQPKVVDPDVTKSTPTYSNVAAPLKIDHHIHLLKANELIYSDGDQSKGYARIGLGTPLNTLAELHYPIISSDRNLLDVGLQHLGAFKEKIHAKTLGYVNYNHLFEKFDLYAGLSGRNDHFNYYGRNFLSNTPIILSDIANRFGNFMYTLPGSNSPYTLYNISGSPLFSTHNRLSVNAGVRTRPEFAENLVFDMGFNYNLFNNVGLINEDNINFKAIFSVPFNDNSLGMDVDIMNFNYSDKQGDFSFPENYSVIKLNPYLQLHQDSWRLRLGVKTGISIGHGMIFTPSPDVYVEWFALPTTLSLYAGATGDLKVNSLYNSLLENRYLDSNIRIDDTYTPIDGYFGIKLSPASKLMLDLFGSFKVIQNQYFYVNKEYSLLGSGPIDNDGLNFDKFFSNRFDVVYSSATKASAGFRASWEFRSLLQTHLKAAYHHWNVKHEAQAWHNPKWDADFGIKVNVIKDLSIGTNFVFQDGRWAKLISNNSNGIQMPAVYDLSLTSGYVYNDRLSFFLKANNILNNKHQLFNGYNVQGINFMVGAGINF